jgi:hypothetical protein
MLLALCAGQYVAGLYTRPRYGLHFKKGGHLVDEYANVWDDYGYDYEDYWEFGIPFGLDDEFKGDEFEGEAMDCD